MRPRIVTRLTSSMAGSAELVRGQPRPDSGLPATCPVVGQVAAWRGSCRAAVAPAARSMVREVVPGPVCEPTGPSARQLGRVV
jgi:hypothetical protein